MPAKPNHSQKDAQLRHLAEKRLQEEGTAQPQGDQRRILHELQVHQIQLEMQNEELRETRFRLENLLERYTDLYDFAPVGYFSLDTASRIIEVNLPGAAMLGVDRSTLLRRRFSGFVARSGLATLQEFLGQVFTGAGKQVCELAIETAAKKTVWVDLQATESASTVDGKPLCRLSLSDITAKKRAAKALLRVEALEATNTALESEIAKRRASEQSLRESRRSQSLMLKNAKRMEKELRLLSHQIIHTQEKERKRISQDLHDEIAQTLVAINVQLAILAQGADLNPVQKALNGKKIKRLGLIGMRERVDMVGGKFAITSSPGKGTTVRVNVPNAQKIQPPT